MAFITAWMQSSSRGSDGWVFAGRLSSFPNIEEPGADLLKHRPCGSDNHLSSSCKVFNVPRTCNSDSNDIAVEVPQDADTNNIEDAVGGLRDQVLMFRYRNKLYAVDNECPHSSYPLSRGSPFDIEDFGVIFGAGLMCAKHGWSFDLFSGRADRSNYRLNVWEVQLRSSANKESESGKALTEGNGDKDEDDPEVWVRRKEERLG